MLTADLAIHEGRKGQGRRRLRGLSLSLTLKHTKDNNPQNNKHRMMLILSRNIHKGQCFFLYGEGQGTKMRAPLKAEERRKGGKEAAATNILMEEQAAKTHR